MKLTSELKKRREALLIIGVSVIICLMPIIYIAYVTRPDSAQYSEDSRSISEFLELKYEPKEAKMGYYPINASRVPGPTDWDGYAVLTYDGNLRDSLIREGKERAIDYCVDRNDKTLFYEKNNTAKWNVPKTNKYDVDWYQNDLIKAFQESGIECVNIYQANDVLVNNPHFDSTFMVVDQKVFVTFSTKI